MFKTLHQDSRATVRAKRPGFEGVGGASRFESSVFGKQHSYISPDPVKGGHFGEHLNSNENMNEGGSFKPGMTMNHARHMLNMDQINTNSYLFKDYTKVGMGIDNQRAHS